jgi:excisionase family DNA binding protein
MEKIFVTREAAEILRLSESRVRTLAKTGVIKAFKEGRKGGFRFTEESLTDYIENAQKKLLSENE